MTALLLFLSHSFAFAATDCSIDRILQNPINEAVCIEQFLKKIPDGQDRSEIKYKLSRWSPRKDLKVYSDHGLIEAVQNDKTIFRAIWLKMRNPAILWLDGKILIDKSNNPSIARTLDNMFRQNKTASLIIPEAQAEDLRDDLVKDTILYYTLGPGMTGKADEVVRASRAEDPRLQKNLSEFLPSSSFLSRLLEGNKVVKCTSQKLVESASFTYGEGYGLDLTIKVTPKSATEFIVQGIETDKTHLVTISSWPMQVTMTRVVQTLHPRASALKAQIATCQDSKCDQTSQSMLLEDRNLMFRHGTEKEAKDAQKRSSSNNQTYKELSKEIRYKMVGQMFGLSIMGSCCGNTICQEQLLAKYGVELQPTPTGSESSAVH